MKKTWKTLFTLLLAAVMVFTTASLTAKAETDEEQWLKDATEWMEGCFNVHNVGGLGDINGEWDAEAFLVGSGTGTGTAIAPTPMRTQR